MEAQAHSYDEQAGPRTQPPGLLLPTFSAATSCEGYSRTWRWLEGTLSLWASLAWPCPSQQWAVCTSGWTIKDTAIGWESNSDLTCSFPTFALRLLHLITRVGECTICWRKQIGAVDIRCQKDAGDPPCTEEAWKKDMGSRLIGYGGEEISICKKLSLEQIISGLPPGGHGVGVDALDWVGPHTSTRNFLLNVRGCHGKCTLAKVKSWQLHGSWWNGTFASGFPLKKFTRCNLNQFWMGCFEFQYQPCLRPAGWEKCDRETRARWEDDSYKFPPYQYQQQFVFTSDTSWRLVSTNEKELLLGYGYRHTEVAWSAAKIKQNQVGFSDARNSFMGDCFSIHSFVLFAVAWL